MAREIEDEHVDSLSTHDKNLRVKNFIWCKEKGPLINHNDFADKEDISVISLFGPSDAKKANEEFYTKVWHEMVNASQKWEFLKLVDHGVSDEIIKNMKAGVKLKGVRSETLPLGYSAVGGDYAAFHSKRVQGKTALDRYLISL